MTRILLVRSIPLDRDSRSSRTVKQYEARGHTVLPLVWTRGQPSDGDPAWSFTGPGEYGRGFMGLASRLRFAAFIVARIVRKRHVYDVVHVVDFDTGCVAVPLAKLLGKTVVYDGFDHVAAIAGGGLAGRALALLERLLIGWSDLVIFPEPIRLRQYGLKLTPAMHFISNIPDHADVPAAAPPSKAADPVTIAYVGTLEARHRALEWIPDLCQQFPAIRWMVAGLGALADHMECVSRGHENLTFLGQVPYQKALKILQDADCHLGCYLLSAPAHEFAAPNKVYEHLVLARPLITNRGTPAGDLVSAYDTGFVFDGTPTGLAAILGTLTRGLCLQKGANARRVWQETFAGKREAQLDSYFDALGAAMDGRSAQ